MANPTIKERLVDRFLDPSSSLGEVVFGLIMVLTFTLGAGVIAPEDTQEARNLIFAAIGCNVAWGIIDGALYLLNVLFERSRMVRARTLVARARDEASKIAIVDHHVKEVLGHVLLPADRLSLSRTILGRLPDVPPPKGVTREDLLGACMSFVMVVLSCIPAAVPFFFIHDPRIALRVSNGLLLAMLFLAGWQWARFTNTNRFIAGIGLLVLGLVLVGVAMALGG